MLGCYVPKGVPRSTPNSDDEPNRVESIAVEPAPNADAAIVTVDGRTEIVADAADVDRDDRLNLTADNRVLARIETVTPALSVPNMVRRAVEYGEEAERVEDGPHAEPEEVDA